MNQTKLINLGIFGSYNKASIGDSAILQGIIDQFKEDINSLTVFAFDPDDVGKTVHFNNTRTRILFGKPIFYKKETSRAQLSQKKQVRNNIKRYIKNKKLLLRTVYYFYKPIKLLKNDFRIYYSNKQFWEGISKEIKKLDLLLIGGGNIIMDLYPSWPIYPLIYTLLAKRAKIPVMLYAVGAGPINSFRAKIYFKIMCHLADGITTRDKNSTREIKMLGIKSRKIITSADPAMCINFNKQEIRKELKSAPIGITIVPYFDKRYWPNGDETIYKEYVKKMALLVDKIVIQLHQEVLFFTTNFPNDLLVCYDIYNKATQKDKIFIIKERLTVAKLLSTISNCEIVVGTRLHSLILSYITLTPFLAFGYQPKVYSFCREYWSSNFFIPLDKNLDFSIKEITNKLTILLKQREGYRKKWRGHYHL